MCKEDLIPSTSNNPSSINCAPNSLPSLAPNFHKLTPAPQDSIFTITMDSISVHQLLYHHHQQPRQTHIQAVWFLTNPKLFLDLVDAGNEKLLKFHHYYQISCLLKILSVSSSEEQTQHWCVKFLGGLLVLKTLQLIRLLAFFTQPKSTNISQLSQYRILDPCVNVSHTVHAFGSYK
ncbi:hypothetical protein AGLY_010986 [Aphis glycines]|uniref:Uncharacterized protein n=1 Tax=Aphis glycines TaxID=307491 RepID=A0A6G0TDH7_APHGL|nr:hypothetical protein AGLY_010986 [Aphis glycines]